MNGKVHFNHNLLISFLLLFSCKWKESDYSIIKGKIVNSNPQTIYITRYFLDGSSEKLVDSVLIQTLDSDFVIRIPSSDSKRSILKFNLDRNAAFIFLDNAPGIKQLVINMTQLNNYIVMGSQTDKDFNRHYSIIRPYTDSLYFLNNFYQKETSILKRDSINQIIQRIRSTLLNVNIQFALDSTNQSKISIKIALETDFSSYLELYKYFLEKLESKYKSDTLAVNYIYKGRSFIYLLEHDYKIGDTIPNITLTTLTHGNIDFDEKIKSKNMLIFWASYAPKSLTLLRKIILMDSLPLTQVFTFSLDPDSTGFTTAVNRLPNQWIHSYDFNSWNGKLARHFLVKELPFVYLLDSFKKIEYMGTDPVFK